MSRTNILVTPCDNTGAPLPQILVAASRVKDVVTANLKGVVGKQQIPDTFVSSIQFNDGTPDLTVLETLATLQN